MKTEILLERDMLYPTDNINEPGSIHVSIFNPNSNARIPAVVESKSGHSPLKYLDSIIRIMQSDMFDRVFINLRKTVDLYIISPADVSEKYGGRKYVKVSYKDEKAVFEGVDDIT